MCRFAGLQAYPHPLLPKELRDWMTEYDEVKKQGKRLQRPRDLREHLVEEDLKAK